MADTKNNAEDFITRIFYQATCHYKSVKELEKRKYNSEYHCNPVQHMCSPPYIMEKNQSPKIKQRQLVGFRQSFQKSQISHQVNDGLAQFAPLAQVIPG